LSRLNSIFGQERLNPNLIKNKWIKPAQLQGKFFFLFPLISPIFSGVAASTRIYLKKKSCVDRLHMGLNKLNSNFQTWKQQAVPAQRQRKLNV